jgi:hypothetical protein
VPLHGIGFFPKDIAAVVSLIAVAVPFGGTLGLTIMATVFNNVSGIGSRSSIRSFEVLSHLDPSQLEVIIDEAKVIQPCLVRRLHC